LVTIFDTILVPKMAAKARTIGRKQLREGILRVMALARYGSPAALLGRFAWAGAIGDFFGAAAQPGTHNMGFFIFVLFFHAIDLPPFLPMHLLSPGKHRVDEQRKRCRRRGFRGEGGFWAVTSHSAGFVFWGVGGSLPVSSS
jgi:hypothetical protein